MWLSLQSIHGHAKSIEDTENVCKILLPIHGEKQSWRIVYAVHRILGPKNALEDKSTEFIGLASLKSLDDHTLALPDNLTKLSAADANTIVTMELSYAFLPSAWGKGYATESVSAVLASCKMARSFWIPFEKVYIRAILDGDNAPSMRVMEKTGMKSNGIFVWTGKPVFIGGLWRERSDLHIFGMSLLDSCPLAGGIPRYKSLCGNFGYGRC